MYELIVLGIIPGTHIQISFEEWAKMASALGLLVLVWRIHRAHLVRNTVITAFLTLEMRRKSHVVEAL
jgi:hypothetical protein